MANWEDIVDDRIMMGRARPLFHAVNELRRRREEGVMERRPGIIPFWGGGLSQERLGQISRKGSWEEIIITFRTIEGEVGHSPCPH